jgi:hypothetical protein
MSTFGQITRAAGIGTSALLTISVAMAQDDGNYWMPTANPRTVKYKPRCP